MLENTRGHSFGLDRIPRDMRKKIFEAAAKRDDESDDRAVAIKSIPAGVGRHVIDMLASDGLPLPAQIIMRQARFHHDRFERVLKKITPDMDEEEREKLETLAGKIGGFASTEAAKIAAFFHPKLASVEHTGGAGSLGAVTEGVNMVVVGMLDLLAKGAAKARETLEGQATDITPVAAVADTNGGVVKATTLEEISSELASRVLSNAERLQIAPITVTSPVAEEE